MGDSKVLIMERMSLGKIIPKTVSSYGNGSSRTLAEIMASYERVIIIQALQLNGFSRTLTAASLGIRRNQLYKRIKILNIQLSEMPGNTTRKRG